jgi:hypothetical protein
VNQEAKFQEQLAELAAQLTARDNESNKLRYQMEDLQRDVLIKSSGMDRKYLENICTYCVLTELLISVCFTLYRFTSGAGSSSQGI